MTRLLLYSLFTLFISNLICAQTGITLYEHNFSGASKVIQTNWQANGSSANFNDKISSIKVPKGKILVLYEGVNFDGARKIIGSDWTARGKDAAWNDQVSSIKIMDPSKPYTMVYECFLEDPETDTWKRTDDISLLSSSKMFIGINHLTNYKVDSSTAALTFFPDDNQTSEGKVMIEGNGVKGWIKKPGVEKRSFYGSLKDLYLEEHIPTEPRQGFDQQPFVANRKQQATTEVAQPAAPTTNVVVNTVPLRTRGYITLYSGDNFTGESMIIDSNWSVNSNKRWWRKVKSIRVSEGWAIRIYSLNNFKGYEKDLTSDWSLTKDGTWNNDDPVHSIKILRKETW